MLEYDAVPLVLLCIFYVLPPLTYTTVDNCTDGSMRLVGGRSPNEGRVEICLNSQWGTVCHDLWGTVDAQVACRQLGYLSTGIMKVDCNCEDEFVFVTTGALSFTYAHFSQGTGPIQLDNMQCTGNEQTILQCSHSTIDNCGHSQDAGIRCRGKRTSSSIICVQTSCSLICTESCSVQGSVRLIGGQTETVGRVEVCSGGVWGTVCDDLWDTPDAQVVCRQLGYSTIGGYTVMCFAKMQKYDRSTGVIARTAAYYGQGAGVTLLDDVQCGGTELKLTDCSHVTNKVCAHSKDADM